jgi:hypothetical protein
MILNDFASVSTIGIIPHKKDKTIQVKVLSVTSTRVFVCFSEAKSSQLPRLFFNLRLGVSSNSVQVGIHIYAVPDDQELVYQKPFASKLFRLAGLFVCYFAVVCGILWFSYAPLLEENQVWRLRRWLS